MKAKNNIKLSEIDPKPAGTKIDKEKIKLKSDALLNELYDLLYLMFAENKHSLLIILQGIDTSGKDGTIRHLMEGCNPQGVRIHSFKKPTDEELRNHFLWRCQRISLESGFTTIFNRSYYEEVVTTMVHPEYIKAQHLPAHVTSDPDFFKKRYRQINDYERMLTENGTVVMKFFLHISKDEQKTRIQERLHDPKKNWKFSEADIHERKHWSSYMKSFEAMIQNTSTLYAPWFVIPADVKWYRNYLITEAVVKELRALKMKFPRLQSKEILRKLK